MVAFARLLAFLALFTLAGCGGKDSSKEVPETKPAVVQSKEQGVAPDNQTPKKTDLELIQGTWKLEWAESKGKKEPTPPKGLTMSFQDDVMVFDGGGEQTFQLDSTKSHKVLESWRRLNESKVKSIYELDGDSLKLYFVRGGAEPPADFKNAPGPDVSILSFKRDLNAPLPQDAKEFPKAIVGKWQGVEGVTDFFGLFYRDTEFTEDGRLLRLDDNKKMTERYKYRFEKRELVLKADGEPEERFKIESITADQLVSKNPSGKLKRVK